MKFRDKEIDWKFTGHAVLCIAAGTGAGFVVYGIFLRLHIAIFGWNLGLIFAPLIAGYVETILANRILGENIGAISAFILFLDTTFYSFILKNPTLGTNLITAGSIIVILQAAFPTLVNYLLLVVLGGILIQFIKTFKKIGNKIKKVLSKQNIFRWEGDKPIDEDVIPFFDEQKSNQDLNNLNFYFLTSSDMKDRDHKIIKHYHSEVIIEKDLSLVNTEPEKAEMKTLVRIKESKDECLIKLVDKVKKDGGNGVLDLSMNYSLIGLGGDNIQITAMGMGIYIE